jgi:DNA topoisomerase-2
MEAQSKMVAQLDRNNRSGGRGKRVLGIPKLEDANEAGGKKGSECTLILTEGDSAKALAVAGLGVIGRDFYGVFPLRGKLLNVRDVTQKQLMENKEIQNIVKALGITFGARGERARMRYGAVMIMADQDHDGSHIKGLLVNLFHYWWPDLLKQGNFVKQFVTPIVKVTKGAETKSFFTQIEYEAWKEENDGARGWNAKYYKGLGTSTAAEAKEYFKAMDQHRMAFTWQSNKDGELIDMAFNKSRADDRKKWMNNYEAGSHIDHSEESLSYQDFVNKELVQFARYSVMRSVPSVMDGFKPGQRQVMFCCIKRNLRHDVKVAQLVGYVGEHSAYHHGEASLSSTIVNMAQDFIGTNNLNLLVPSGMFGTRLTGGSDAASARYIYTRLTPWSRLIFHPFDDPILSYLTEDGQRIEPNFYAPVIPMVLVNGASGIGTGWSTDVPNYDPRAIIANLRLFLKKQKMKPMKPWYRGFTGSIQPNGRGAFCTWGKCKENDKGFEITELPVRKWTQDYKEFLHTMLPGAETANKNGIKLDDVREYHTENRVHFSLKANPEEIKKINDAGPENALKLWSNISENNLVLFDSEGRIKKYKSEVEILEDFAKVRLQYYDKRKQYLIKKLTLERDLLTNRARFIKMIIEKKLKINNRKKADVVKDLARLKFQKFGDTRPPRSGFEYLLIMQIASLTKERYEELLRMAKDKAKELENVKKTSIQAMWTTDLDRLEEAIVSLYSAETEKAKEAAAGAGAKKRPAAAMSSSRKVKGGKSKSKGKRGESPMRLEEEEESEEEKADDLDGNPIADMGRWTTGALQAFTESPVAMKKRRKA